MNNAQISPQHIGGDHSGDIDRIFGRTELRRITQLRFFQIKDCCLFLDSHGNDIDALFNAFFSNRLGTYHPAVLSAENEFQTNRTCPWIVTDMMAGMQIDFFQRNRFIPDFHASEGFLTGPRKGHHQTQYPNNGCSLDPPEFGIPAHDGIRCDSPLPVCRTCQRNNPPLTGYHVFDLNGISNRPDFLITSAHVLIDTNPFSLTDFQPGLFSQFYLRPNTDGKDHYISLLSSTGFQCG